MQAVQWSTFKSTLLRSGVVQASQLTVPNAWYDNPLFVTQVLNVSIHTNALKQQKKEEKREMNLRCNQWIDITYHWHATSRMLLKHSLTIVSHQLPDVRIGMQNAGRKIASILKETSYNTAWPL